MTLTALVLRRLLLGVLVLVTVSVLVFAATEILPGDVAQAILGQGATPEAVANVRARLGLDEPAHLRYIAWAGWLATGDLGTSLSSGADIGDLIGERIGNTMLLAGVAAALAVPLSICLGLLCALRPNGPVDRIVSGLSLALISVPGFLVAIPLVMLFAVQLGWLPAIASRRPGQDAMTVARMLVLPVTVLVFTVLAHMVRMTRTAVVNVLSTPAIEMAILKGVPRWRLLLVHALPNALGPIANVVALNLAFLIGTTLGFVAAVKRGWIDTVLSRMVDTLISFPATMIALMVISGLGSSYSVLVVTVALIDATRVFRVARALGMDIVVQDYVEAPRVRAATCAARTWPTLPRAPRRHSTTR